MTVRCIIVDDEPMARKGMMEYINQVDFLEIVGVFEQTQSVGTRLEELHPDLIFLDIEMPGPSGIDFIRSLRKSPLIILTTAYTNYAIESYELNVVDYLVKPILFPRFLKAVNKAREILLRKDAEKLIPNETTDHFFIKENGRFTKVFYKDILFAEALQNYVALYLPDKKLISYITLAALEAELPASMFMRIHKSYIVALEKIASIEGGVIRVGSAQIPVSRKIKDQLMKTVLENKLLKR